jgi:hypothetical protein
MKKDISPPKTTAGDAGHAVVRSALGAIPFAGSTAIELFSSIIVPPLEQRRIEWMENIGEAIQTLIENDEKLTERLQNDPAFIDMLLAASQIAMKTSQEIKIESLKNAVLNSTKPSSIDATTQSMFISVLDSLTDWHIKILDLFHDPPKWAERNDHTFPSYQMGGLANILESAFPELSGKRGFYDLINRDLFNTGLLNTDSFHGTMSGNGLMQKRTTEFGVSFLLFISEPPH